MDVSDFGKQNYTYNAETGILEINVQNTPNGVNEITWAKNVQDEYLVTYVFEGKDIYDYVVENGLDTNSKITAEIEVFNSDAEIEQDKEQENSDKEDSLENGIGEETTGKIATAVNVHEIQMNGTVGNLLDFEVNTTKEIGKGQIYANYDAEEDKKVETNYVVEYTAIVNSAYSTNGIELKQNYDKFVTEEGEIGLTTVSGNNYTYNKEIIVSEKLFNRILGEDGSIEILRGEDNTKIGTINKDTEKREDTNGNKYYVIDIREANCNTVVIKTSKPVDEGKLVIMANKAVKGKIEYNKEQMKDFTKIETEAQGKNILETNEVSTNITNERSTLNKTIQLKETATVANIEISKPDLTTVVKNENVEIRAVLDISNTNNALYKNPKLKIKLPSYISNIEIKEQNILMGNGLKIKSVKLTEENNAKVINVELEGTQSEYLLNAEYKGSILVLNTNITVKTLTPTNENEITMEYVNENELAQIKNGITSTDIKFVAPAGVVAANGISNYADGKSDIISISNESKAGELATYADKRIAKVYGTIINNYPNNIGNITILGRLPSKDNKKIDSEGSLNSTFDTILNSVVNVKGIEEGKYTIYYSENANASTDINNTENGWTTTATTGTKSYLIVTNNFEMETGKIVEFSYDIEIPANLKHNNNAYQMYKVYYNNASSLGRMTEAQESAIVGLTTGEGPELTAEVYTKAEVIREGQYVKMYVKVSNTGTTDAENVKVKVPVPEHATFAEYIQGNGFSTQSVKEKSIDVGRIKQGESKTVSYYIKMNDNTDSNINDHIGEDHTEEEIDEISKQGEFPKEIANKVTITADKLTGEIPSNEYKISLLEGGISLDLSSKRYETQALLKGEINDYTIRVSNISDNTELQNCIVTMVLPKGLKYKEGSITERQDTVTGSADGINYDESTNTLKINLGTLQANKYILLKLEVGDYEGNVELMATAIAEGLEEHYSNKLEYVTEKLDIEVSTLTSTPKYVKELDNITYNFKITNKGNTVMSKIVIMDKLPDELRYVKSTYKYESGLTVDSTDSRNNQIILNINYLQPGETLEVSIIAKTVLLSDKNDKEVANKITIDAENMETITTNEVTNIIEYYEEAHRNPNTPDGSNPKPTENTYRVTGTAWLDENKNGRRDNGEQVLSNIKVLLLNKADNSLVKNSSNEIIQAITDSNGKYTLSAIPKGEYLVLFVYDAGKYSLTTYQAKDVEAELNSDAIDINITLDGERRIAGITDIITISNQNIRDIDIGLYSAEKFDLRLDKYISKITLTTPTIGTKTYTYDNKQTAKVEVLGQNLGKSNIVIEYKIVVKNEGAIAGYVKKIVDYLPKELSFASNLNKDWYLLEDGNVYNTSLANELISPGETKEITLIATKKITESSIGVVNNTAEIYEAYNEQGMLDIDSTPGNKVAVEDDMSQADLVISLVTGTIIKYTAITLVIIAIIGFGVFEIRKRVLKNKE